MRILNCLALSLLLTALSGVALAEGVSKLDLDNIGTATGDASAAQPSEADFKTFADQGYVAVIDLRGEGEDRGFDEAAAAAAAGLDYSPLPIPDRSAIDVDNARKLGELLDQYDGPVVVHCGSGNRVGALVALLEADRGASNDEALEAGRAAGLTRLEEVVIERLEEGEAK